jgi:predicted metal-binding membrane protein
MAVFVGVGAMSLPWAVAIAVVVLVEKVMRHGVWLGRVIGGALIAASLLVLARPDLATHLAGGM